MAIARPIPLPAPEMIAFLPSSLMSLSVYLPLGHHVPRAVLTIRLSAARRPEAGVRTIRPGRSGRPG